MIAKSIIFLQKLAGSSSCQFNTFSTIGISKTWAFCVKSILTLKTLCVSDRLIPVMQEEFIFRAYTLGLESVTLCHGLVSEEVAYLDYDHYPTSTIMYDM